MQHFKTITNYCKAINISPPEQAFFDIRSFEENMPTVVEKMLPFKHEFYAIAIKIEGTGKAITGDYTNFPKGATLFFNTPFQLISWDILPDWKGFYVMFSKEFITKSKHLKNLLTDFPFLKIDTSIPFGVKPKEVSKLLQIYENIYIENYQLQNDSSEILEAHLLVLLNYVKRYFKNQVHKSEAITAFRKADINLLSRFQTLIETSFYETSAAQSKTHSTRFYAEKLAVHPNYLNATIKQITGNTAKQHINNHLVRLAKSQLLQTSKSVKEIAYTLHFSTPNNFNSFFKKQTGLTPNSFRKNQ